MSLELPLALALALAQSPAPNTPPAERPATRPSVATSSEPTAPAAPPTAPDPTPAQLFQRAIELVGALDQAPCLRAEGTIETSKGRSEIVMLWNARAPRRLVVRERMADGRLAEWGCDGERGWMRVPGRDAPIEVEPAAVLASKAALVPSLMVLALADRFPHRTAAGTETLDGVPCRRIDLEDRDGLPGAAWFELHDGRLRAFETRGTRAEAATRTTVEAWSKAGPLQVPSRLVSRSGESVVRTVFTALATDPIADEAFRPPVPE